MPDKLLVEKSGFVHQSKIQDPWAKVFLSAQISCEMSSDLCAAVKVTRKRAAPRATAG
jgi:hypothetical protein